MFLFLSHLLLEEGINVTEMKMMKLHHINHLLHQYPMGVQIRFEYHWEKWRRQLGKPVYGTQQSLDSFLCSHIANNYNRCCHSMDDQCINRRFSSMSYNNQSLESERQFNKQNKEPNIQVEQHIEENISSIVESFPEHRTNSDNDSVSAITSYNSLAGNNLNIAGNTDMQLDSIEKNLPKIIENKLDNDIIVSEDVNGDDSQQPTKVNLEQHITTDGEVSDNNNECLIEQNTNARKCNNNDKNAYTGRALISLKQILRMSGAQGQALTKYYQTHKRFTPAQRSQLLQIIVDFFDAHNYHLSLHTSHNLEWQILKMFPSEKLEYYRTEKRGKIYVKFSNKKRYKRDSLYNRNNKRILDTTKRLRFLHTPIVYFPPDIDNSNNLVAQQKLSSQQQHSNYYDSKNDQITIDEIKLEQLTDEYF